MKIGKNLLRRINLTLPRDAYGRRIRVPVISGVKVGVTNEPWMFDVLRRLLPHVKGGLVDVGANLGQTLVKFRAADATRPYVGFEPNPFCLHYLQELNRANKFAARFIPVGLGDHTGLLRFSLFSDSPADPMATTVPGFRGDRKVTGELIIPVFRLDELTDQLPGEVGLIKIDVEGGELEALTGMAGFIRTQAPLILIELLPVYKPENQLRLDRQTKVEATFKAWGYELHRVRKNSLKRLAGFEHIPAIGIHNDLELCDYVAAPTASAGLLRD